MRNVCTYRSTDVQKYTEIVPPNTLVTILLGVQLECKEPLGSEVHKVLDDGSWEGQGRSLLFFETASYENNYQTDS